MYARATSRQTAAADGDEPFVLFRVPAIPRSSRGVREGVASFAKSMGVPEWVLPDVLSALGEALANAIQHSSNAAPIEVQCQVSDDRIVATVRDFGVGLSGRPDPTFTPACDLERGRGFAIMRAFSDVFEARSVPGGGTLVVVGRYLRLGRGTSSPRQLGQRRARAVPHDKQNVHS